MSTRWRCASDPIRPSVAVRRRNAMTDVRCYTVPDLLIKLQLAKTTFHTLRRAGRRPRYRADLVDRYLRGEWPQASLTFFRRQRSA
jgi:hypothetical protein